MQRSQSVWNPILSQVIADRHLAAKTITAKSDAHLARIIRSRLNQNRNLKVRQPDCIGNAALFTKVRQRDDDAVDPTSVPLKQLRTRDRLLIGINSTKRSLLR